MKLKYQIKFALDIMLIYGKQLIGSIILGGFVFLLIAVLILMNEMNSNLRSELEIALRNDCKNTGYIIRNNIAVENLTSQVLSLDCIDAAGVWQLYSASDDCLETLKTIQGNHVQEEANVSEDYLELIGLDLSAWNMFDFKLCSGQTPDYAINNQEYKLLYLGYEYEKYVDVGTIFMSENDPNKYIVAGILGKGNKIAESDMHLLNKFSITSAYPLDYAVVMLYQTPISDYTFFTVADGYSFAEAENNLIQLAKQNSTSVTIYSIDALLSAVERSLEPVNRYMIQIIIVVGMTVCIVFTCFQTMDVLMRQSEYGIMYANGATTRDLIGILLLENSIKMFLSFIITLPLLLLISKTCFQANYGDYYIIKAIILKSVSWKLGITGILIIMISSIIPISIIKKSAPVTLIGGNNT